MSHRLVLAFVLCVTSVLRAQAPATTQPTTAPTERLKHGTTIAPTLDTPLEYAKTVLWCASLQIAWDELAKARPEVLDRAARSPATASLAASRFPRAWVGEGDVVAEAGDVGGELVERVEQQLKENFGDTADAQLFQAARQVPGLAMYAYLQKRLAFRIPFDSFEMWYGWRTREPVTEVDQEDPDNTHILFRVRAFGIDDLDPLDRGEVDRAGQVRIHWVDDEVKQYVVELQTVAEDERLILAKLQRPPTLREAVRVTLGHVAVPNTVTVDVDLILDLLQVWEQFRSTRQWMRRASPDTHTILLKLLALGDRYARLRKNESLKIPMLFVDLTTQMPNVAEAAGLAAVFQRVKFVLDAKGVELISEAWGLFGAKPRSFDFDGGFLVMLIRRDAPLPYFAAWIGNDDLMHVIEAQNADEEDASVLPAVFGGDEGQKQE